MKNLKKNSKINFSITVLAILDNSDFSIFIFFSKNFGKILKVKNFKKNSKFYFSIKVLAISDNSDFSKKKIIFFLGGGGVPQFFFGHFSSTFTLISAHTNFHDPRSTPCGRKVRAERRKEK